MQGGVGTGTAGLQCPLLIGTSCPGNCRPVILDPADPTWDVGSGAAWRWDVLAREAASCYDNPCFTQATGDPVQPWDGLVSGGLPRTLGFAQFMCSVFLSICHVPGQWPGSGLHSRGSRLVRHPGRHIEVHCWAFLPTTGKGTLTTAPGPYLH